MQLKNVSRNYDKASAYYDSLTRFIFQDLLRVENKYRQKTVNLLGELRGKRVLDVGCGTGRNFPFLATAVGHHGEIVGLDYSRGMLSQAQAQIDKRGWQNVSLEYGDAATLDGLGEQQFDAVISTWCLGIVHDLDTALKSTLARVRTGGRIAVMDFQGTQPGYGLLRWLSPVYQRLLSVTGIDSPEDLDDAQLRAKWARGQQYLKAHLTDVSQDSYLQNMGFVIAGTV